MGSICAAPSRPVFDPPAVALACGLRVEIADLGVWGGAVLISEYDGQAGTVRVNARALAAFGATAGAGRADIEQLRNFAIAHELFHHYEARGLVPRLRGRARREAAADVFARANVAVDDRLDAFLRRAAGSPLGI